MDSQFPPESYLNEPQRRHRRQALWQIYLPLAAGCAAFLTLGILVVLSHQTGNPDVSQWAAIAAIWLILPLLALGFAALLANLLFIFLFAKVNSAIPQYGRLARFYLHQVTVRVHSLADRLVEPGINLQSNAAGLGRLFSVFIKNRHS